VKHEFRKLYFMTCDLKVLCDPWRTWIIKQHSWFCCPILHVCDFQMQVLRRVRVIHWEWLAYAICNMKPWLTHSWLSSNTASCGSLKRVSYLLIFVIWESESFKSMIHNPVFFLFMHRARDPSLPCITLSRDETCQLLSFEQYTVSYVRFLGT